MISNFASSAQKYESAYPIKENELPASKRGYHTNNQYDNVPPLMNDGRSLISTNQSDSAENKKLIEENNIQSNWEYRRYLTKNAPKVIESNYMSYTDNGFLNTTMDVPSIQSNVVNYKVKAPLKGSGVVHINEEESEKEDLKINYLSREQLQSRKISPAITQEELIKK
tara:strand:- start:660 stop:1163 length:504 start_codon:yes stop_codon:yes gene_type:complete